VRVVAFEGAHFYNTRLLQEAQTERVVLDIVRVLNHSRDGAHNVYQVVALVVNGVYFSACLRELPL
jgi:hypothetical protein